MLLQVIGKGLGSMCLGVQFVGIGWEDSQLLVVLIFFGFNVLVILFM